LDKVNIFNFYSNKTVLITGITGFKGSWLAFILKNIFNANVIGYGLEPNSSPSLYNLLDLKSHTETLISDIRSYHSLDNFLKKHKPEVVFHLAAQPLVLESYMHPKDTYEINTIGTLNLLESIRNTSFVKSLVNITTDKVYKNKEWIWGYREDEELDGFDPYSNSKSLSELITRTYKRSLIKNSAVSSVRAGNVIGGGDFSKNRLMVDCINSAKNKLNIEIRNPKSVRPYQHVYEPIYFYIILAYLQFYNFDLSGEYNVGPDYDDCVNNEYFVKKFIQFYDPNLSWSENRNNQFHEANFLYLDNSKIKKIFNYKPIWNFDTAIFKSVEWYKELLTNPKNISAFSLKQVKDFSDIKFPL